MERNAGVTARAGPGRDSGNAEVVVSHTLPLLAQRENSHPKSQKLGIDGSQDLGHQSWTKAPVPNNPKIQGFAEHIRTGIPDSPHLPNKTPHPTKSIQGMETTRN